MRLRITVEGTAYDVDVEILEDGRGAPASPLPARAAPPAMPSPAAQAAPPAPSGAPASAPPKAPSPGPSGAKDVQSPIAGSVLSIAVKAGDAVAMNDTLLVLEAMKMESNVASPTEGTVKSVDVAVGDAVQSGQVLVTFE